MKTETLARLATWGLMLHTIAADIRRMPDDDPEGVELPGLADLVDNAAQHLADITAATAAPAFRLEVHDHKDHGWRWAILSNALSSTILKGYKPTEAEALEIGFTELRLLNERAGTFMPVKPVAPKGSSKWGPDFPPSTCTTREDCAHDGHCHDASVCGIKGPANTEDDEPEGCLACGEPLKPGDRVLDDVSGGTLHTACAGPEREGYTGADGEPLKPGEPIPEGYVIGEDFALSGHIKARVATIPKTLPQGETPEPCNYPYCGCDDDAICGTELARRKQGASSLDFHRGIDYGLTQLCRVLGVDLMSLNWEAPTESVEKDVRSLCGNILTKWAGGVWHEAATSPSDKAVTREGVDDEAGRGVALEDVFGDFDEADYKPDIASAIAAEVLGLTWTHAPAVGEDAGDGEQMHRYGDVQEAVGRVLEAARVKTHSVHLGKDATPTPPVSPSLDSTGPAGALPPMPPTTDREPFDTENPAYDGYLESNVDWARTNDEAVKWLADNHHAIRAALTPSAPIADPVRDAIKGISDDYMTSENHHPGYVLIPAAKFEQLRVAEQSLKTDSTGQGDAQAEAQSEPGFDKGIDYTLTQLCACLGVDTQLVQWDAATETLDGDVQAVACNILTLWAGEDWRDIKALARFSETCIPAEGEPAFVLLGRDPQSPDIVEAWARVRKQLEPNVQPEKIANAYRIADAMRVYFHANKAPGDASPLRPTFDNSPMLDRYGLRITVDKQEDGSHTWMLIDGDWLVRARGTAPTEKEAEDAAREARFSYRRKLENPFRAEVFGSGNRYQWRVLQGASDLKVGATIRVQGTAPSYAKGLAAANAWIAEHTPAPQGVPRRDVSKLPPVRPDNCTMSLRARGEPSPKSGCVVDGCGMGGMCGCPYETGDTTEKDVFN